MNREDRYLVNSIKKKKAKKDDKIAYTYEEYLGMMIEELRKQGVTHIMCIDRGRGLND